MLLVNSVVGSLFRFPPLEQPLESLTVSRKGLPHMAREMTPQETGERKCRFCDEAIRNLTFSLECVRCRVLAFLCGEKKVNP